MQKTDKAAKRKAKLRVRKRQMNADRIGLATRLSSALERLCAPVLPEYIDDSRGLDLIGRQIVYQMGMIAWNIAVTGQREMADTALLIEIFATVEFAFPSSLMLSAFTSAEATDAAPSRTIRTLVFVTTKD